MNWQDDRATERDPLREELQRKIEVSLLALQQAKNVLARLGENDEEAWAAFTACVMALRRWQQLPDPPPPHPLDTP